MEDVTQTGMTHEIMKKMFLHAVGGRPPMSMRDSWAEFIRNKSTEFFMKDEWVKKDTFWKWLFDQPAFETSCYDEGVMITLVRFGNGPYT